jgi:hypothetical protein
MDGNIQAWPTCEIFVGATSGVIPDADMITESGSPILIENGNNLLKE